MNCVINQNKTKGFTLLEVLVALTLTSMVLGSLFALQSQSKRLSFKAQDSLVRVINQRAYFNLAWMVGDKNMDLSEAGVKSLYKVEQGEALKKPDEQKKEPKFFLQSFDLQHEKNGKVISGVRFKESDKWK